MIIRKGFSLIELLICLAVLSILLIISTPSLDHLVKKQRSNVVISELKQLIYFARQQAVSKRTFTTLCPTEDQVICDNNWGRQLMLFTDRNKNETVDEGDEILRFSSLVAENGGSLILRVAGRKYLQFNSRGFTNGKFGNLTYCPSSNDLTLARRLIINRTGRIRLEKDNDGDNIIDTSTPLLCIIS